MHIIHLYRQVSSEMEFCFNIEASGPLAEGETARLKFLLADGFMEESVGTVSCFQGGRQDVIELGPRLNFATA